MTFQRKRLRLCPQLNRLGTSGALIDTLVVSPPAVAHPQAETPAVAHVDLTATPDQPHYYRNHDRSGSHGCRQVRRRAKHRCDHRKKESPLP